MDSTPENAVADVHEKSKRRWFQFSLRTMLIVMLLVGVGFGWVAYERRKAGQFQIGFAAIQKMGRVSFEDQKLFRSAILKTMLGDDSFRYATSVEVVSAPFTDTQAEHLKGLTQLRVLRLLNTPISDAGLVYLRELHQLQELSLDNTRITERGLTHLREMKNLKYLILDGTQTIGPGLVHLREMKQLV